MRRVPPTVIFLIWIASPLVRGADAPSEAPIVPDWNVLSPNEGNGQRLRSFLLREAKEQYSARTKAFQTALASAEALNRYAQDKRRAYLDLLGQFPDPTPLRAQATGRIKCAGYTIEKVLFETLPRHRATALLYVPEGSGPFPGVLFVCGHSVNGKAAEDYQRVPALMARHGLLVLAVDPIGQGERLQQSAVRGGTTTHTLYDIGARLVGRSVVFYEVWDNVRAIDYLMSRPEADRKRPVGLTGTSGGGTQTTFLMAFDERVGPASPSCYLMTRQRKFETIGPADGCQHLWDEGHFGIDHADYAIMRLTKPTQLLAAEYDFFDIQATRQAALEIGRAFDVAGRSDRFQLVVSPSKHGFKPGHRVAATNWMRRWLLSARDNVTDADDLAVFPDDEIQVTRTGQVATDFSDEVNVGQLNRERGLELQTQRDAFESRYRPDERFEFIGRLLRLAQPREKAIVRRVAAFQHADCQVEKLVIERPDDVPLPALLFTSERTPGARRPATLIADSRGKSAAVESAVKLASRGHLVLAVDLRGYGETRDVGSKSKYFNHEQATAYLAMHIGSPLLGQRVADVLDAVDVLSADSRVDQQDIQILGVQAAGPVALHAAALDSRIRSYRTADSITSWNDDVVAKPLEPDLIGYVVPRALQYYDLPDLARWVEASRSNGADQQGR